MPQTSHLRERGGRGYRHEVASENVLREYNPNQSQFRAYSYVEIASATINVSLALTELDVMLAPELAWWCDYRGRGRALGRMALVFQKWMMPTKTRFPRKIEGPNSSYSADVLWTNSIGPCDTERTSYDSIFQSCARQWMADFKLSTTPLP